MTAVANSDWVPVVLAGLIGVGGALGGTWLTGHLETKRTREARTSAIREARRDRRDRDLIELLDLMTEFLDAYVALHVALANPANIVSLGAPEGDPLLEPTMRTVRVGQRLRALAYRAGDDELRSRVLAYTATVADETKRPSGNGGAKMQAASDPVLQYVGQMLNEPLEP
jgi:hypothetical protein